MFKKPDKPDKSEKPNPAGIKDDWVCCKPETVKN